MVWQKVQKYFDTYILQIKWVKAMLLPIIILFIVSSYCELHMASNTSEIINGKDFKSRASALNYYIFFMFSAYSLRFVVNIFTAYFVATSTRLAFKNFFTEYLQISYRWFMEIGIGEAQYNIVRRATSLAEFFNILTINLASNVFFLILFLHSIFSKIDFWSRLKITGLILCFIIFSAIMQRVRAESRKQTNLGLQENSKKLYDALFNYERIVAYDNLDIECEQYWDANAHMEKHAIRYWVSGDVISLINSILYVLFQTYLIYIYKMNASIIQAEEIGTFIILAGKLKDRAISITQNIDELFITFVGMAQSMAEDAPLDEKGQMLQLTKFENEIEVQDVSYKYNKNYIFKNINLLINKSDKIAITGTNGGGKSTFIKIILGLYDYEGSIKIDGIESSAASRQSLRGLISYIPQNAYLFDTDIEGNLKIGSQNITNEKILKYCKLFGTHELFKEMGYDKQVGERGKNLSGGQKQKISFMRGILKEAPILILDEATANMDAASELELIKSVNEKLKDKAVLVIIHNLSLLNYFEKILFFNDQTVDCDTFAKLYDRNPAFKAFFDNATCQT
ncbi:ATP-binding cassette, subfamily B, heavy metal transporter [Enteropsectra breve]|nr:ATP-binding cassette, subfamily B, heavy metal transporter [Enteropsectra breve]